VLAEELESLGDGVDGSPEDAVEGACFRARLASRRTPERLALGVVEVAGEAARGHRALVDQVERRENRSRLVEPAEGRLADRHRRPAIAEDDDSRRLVGETLANNELVASPCGREPGRGGPVHPADIVTGPVLARARDVGADAAARATHAAEREPDHAPPGDEREHRCCHG